MSRCMTLAILAFLALVASAAVGCVPPTVPSPTPFPTATAQPAPTAIPPPSPAPTAALISVAGPGIPASILDDIATAIGAGAPGSCAALQVACDFPVAVEVYADQASFDRAVMNPDMRGFFALSGNGRIQVVSPANSGRADLSYEDGVGVAVHEFVHLALDQIAPELPDWLEEGTAVYLGPHAPYDRACREQLSGLALPRLADLRDHYGEVPAPDLFAYTLVASIVDAHDVTALNALLRAPAALEATLGLPAAEIEAAWWTFVADGCGLATSDNE